MEKDFSYVLLRDRELEIVVEKGCGFMRDTLADRRAIRLLTFVETYTHESSVIEVDVSLSAERTVAVFERSQGIRGLPDRITVENGSHL